MEYIIKLFDKQWLCRHPRPKKVVHENSSEFTSFEFQQICSSYSIKVAPTTVKNPRSNSTAERMHLTIGDMLRTMSFDGEDWESEVETALQSTTWAIRSTVNTILYIYSWTDGVFQGHDNAYGDDSGLGKDQAAKTSSGENS